MDDGVIVDWNFTSKLDQSGNIDIPQGGNFLPHHSPGRLFGAQPSKAQVHTYRTFV